MGGSAVIHPPTIPSQKSGSPSPPVHSGPLQMPSHKVDSLTKSPAEFWKACWGGGPRALPWRFQTPKWRVWTAKNGRNHVYIQFPWGDVCLLNLDLWYFLIFSACLWWCAPTTNVEEGWSHQREAMQRSYQFCLSSKPERHTYCCILQSFCNRCLWLICDHVAWLVMFTASADVQVGFQLLKADQSHILDKRSPLAETQKLSKKLANIAFWIRRSKPSKYHLWGDDNPWFASLSSYPLVN